MQASELSVEQAVAAVREYGSVAAAARAVGMERTTFRRRLDGVTPGTPARRKTVAQPVTRDDIDASMRPPNRCPVKLFRDTLDPVSQDALDYAIINKKENPNGAAGVRQPFLDAGHSENAVPSTQAINDHYLNRRPCRCKAV